MDINTVSNDALLQVAQGLSQKADLARMANVKDKDAKKIDAVAQDFEAMFMAEMLKPMFAEIKPDALFGGGKGEEVFQSMMLQEYGKMMAETGQLGIADSVKGQLIKMKEIAENGGHTNPSPKIAENNTDLETIIKIATETSEETSDAK